MYVSNVRNLSLKFWWLLVVILHRNHTLCGDEPHRSSCCCWHSCSAVASWTSAKQPTCIYHMQRQVLTKVAPVFGCTGTITSLSFNSFPPMILMYHSNEPHSHRVTVSVRRCSFLISRLIPPPFTQKIEPTYFPNKPKARNESPNNPRPATYSAEDQPNINKFTRRLCNLSPAPAAAARNLRPFEHRKTPWMRIRMRHCINILADLARVHFYVQSAKSRQTFRTIHSFHLLIYPHKTADFCQISARFPPRFGIMDISMEKSNDFKTVHEQISANRLPPEGWVWYSRRNHKKVTKQNSKSRILGGNSGISKIWYLKTSI